KASSAVGAGMLPTRWTPSGSAMATISSPSYLVAAAEKPGVDSALPSVGLCDRVGNRRMDAHQLGDDFWRPASPAAFRRHAVAGPDPARGRHAALSPLDPIRVVHQPEVQLRLAVQAQVLEWPEVGIVVPIARHRHVDPMNRPRDSRGQLVRHLDKLTHVL